MISRTDGLGTKTFIWNEENQLIQVSLPGSLTVNYKYDGLGRRIQRTTSAGANERYVYDGQDVLLDLNADWSVATTYLNEPGIDDHLRQTNSVTGLSYFLTDHLSSTAALADSSGSIIEQLASDSFGSSTGSTRTRYGYTGRELDPDTGLIYYRARWYDPQQGRFISEDPIGFEGGTNWYAYVENDPLGSDDPLGLRGRPRSRTRARECDPGEMAKCAQMCGSKGVQSCRVSQVFRLVRWKGVGLYKWVDGPLSCSCNDCEDPKLPVPVPRRLSQPGLDELRMLEESDRQMEKFWEKVVIGDALVGTVLLAPQASAPVLIRALSSAARAAPRAAPRTVPVPRLVPAH